MKLKYDELLSDFAFNFNLRPPPWRPHEKRAGNGGGGDGNDNHPSRRPREVDGVLRTYDELQKVSPRNLQRWGLSSEAEYFERREKHQAEKEAMDAYVRDPNTASEDKHHAISAYHMVNGRAFNNCDKCWLLKVWWCRCRLNPG